MKKLLQKNNAISHYGVKKILFVALALLATTNLALAVAIDDSITPQNCSRSDATCARFLDSSSNGQIKWGALVAGGLRSLTNLFVDGKVGIGTIPISNGEQSLRLDVNGAVGARFYCDENGNHCVAGDALGTGGPIVGLLLNGRDGVIVSRNTTTSAYEFSIDPATAQRRVSGFCEANQAIKKVNQDGTVECQAVTGGTSTNFWAGNGTNITNNNSGNVGIGMPNPTYKLQVLSTGHDLISAETTGQFAYITLKDKNGQAEIANDGRNLVLGSMAGGYTIFRVGNLSPMMIGTQGFVGIGTTDPKTSLHVVANDNNVITAETKGQFAYINLKDKNGYAEIANDGGALVLGGGAASPIFFRNSNYLTRMMINAAGNVGIGTTNPHSGEQALKLDVNGAVGARFYCDENGNHCVAGDALASGSGNVDSTVFQRRVTGYCPVGQAVTRVNQDGTVDCGTNGSLLRATLAQTCNASTEGTVYYNSSAKHFMGCNGTTWKQLDN